MHDLHALAGDVAKSDAVIVGSFVPDGVTVGAFVQHHARGVTAFYDIDTPVTLAKLSAGDEYLTPPLAPLVHERPLLTKLERVYGAQRALPLY